MASGPSLMRQKTDLSNERHARDAHGDATRNGEVQHTLTLHAGDAAAGSLRTAVVVLIELRDLLRIQEIDRNAVRDAERLAIERRRTIAAFNQALGELP